MVGFSFDSDEVARRQRLAWRTLFYCLSMAIIGATLALLTQNIAVYHLPELLAETMVSTYPDDRFLPPKPEISHIVPPKPVSANKPPSQSLNQATPPALARPPLEGPAPRAPLSRFLFGPRGSPNAGSATLVVPNNQNGNAAQATPTNNGAANHEAANNGASRALPRLPNSARGTVHAQNCDILDLDERPRDCPPLSHLRQEAEAARHGPGPDYAARTQNRGVSTSMRNAARYVGQRDRCETNGGDQAQVCISLGPRPTQVHTWQEICEARGLGNCTRTPLPGTTNGRDPNLADPSDFIPQPAPEN